MPRVRALNTYSNEFWEIIEACALRQEQFTLPVATITEGLSLQGKFYSFRGALKRAVEEAKLKMIKHPESWDASHERNVNALVWAERPDAWVIRKNVPSTVMFCHKGQHPTSAMLRKLSSPARPVR